MGKLGINYYNPLTSINENKKDDSYSIAKTFMSEGSAYKDEALRKKLDALETATTQDILGSIDYSTIPDYETFMELTQLSGSIKKAGTNNLFGINHMVSAPTVQVSKDSYGLAFFTRPQLNMSQPNLRRNRSWYNLLNTDVNSIHRFVRCTLDPRLGLKTQTDTGNPSGEKMKGLMSGLGNDAITSSLVDPNLGFIPVLTNNLITLDGWPDIILEYFASKEGLHGEQWILGDSRVEIYNSFSLTGRFLNTQDEPITMLINSWVKYISYVFRGKMSPYMDMMIANEIDYNTRIYRLVLDETKRFVKKIAACGAGFPVSLSLGKHFDYSDEAAYNMRNKDIDVQFQCVGAEYNDDITISEFNYVSVIFNPEIRKMYLKGEEHDMVKIPNSMKALLNNRGYPLIDEQTLELNWWINKNSKDFQRLIKYIHI